jgi:hypothetical protein
MLTTYIISDKITYYHMRSTAKNLRQTETKECTMAAPFAAPATKGGFTLIKAASH